MGRDGEAFSNIDLVAQCMSDQTRSAAFDSALKELIKPGMTVLDVGTGSGLLAMMAARAGAGKVLAVELDPLVADAAKRNIEENGLQEQISVVTGDATNWNLPINLRPFDVVVMELLTTAMIDEDQVGASNNLHRAKLVDAHTAFVPGRLDTYVSMGDMNFSVCDFEMKMVRHLWQGFPDANYYHQICDRSLLTSECFSSVIQPTVDKTIELSVREDGVINSVCLVSETFLSPSVSVWDSLAMNAPVVLPVDSFRVSSGDTVRLRIRYTYGAGFGSLKLGVVGVQRKMKNVS
jgi:SAM-dependent methyltransferase